MCGLYLLAGVVDHDPWKTEDARHIGVAYAFFTGQREWGATLAGTSPWHFAELLYYGMAVATAWLTRGWLLFHEGARLASSVFGAIALIGLTGAAQALYGQKDRWMGWITPLLLIGTLGFLTLHEAQPAMAGLAVLSLVYWGVARIQNRAVMTAFIVLAHYAPIFLDAWWHSEGLAGALAWNIPTQAHLKLLIWFTWPALPLALWSIWLNRRRLSSLLLPLVGTLCALLWFLTHEARYTLALPLLVPLVLLAAEGSIRLKRGAASAFDWFGCVTFTGAMGLIWLGASALHLGWPTQIARNFAKLAPGFHAEASLMALMMGGVVTFIWGWHLTKLPRSPWRPVFRWASGVTLSWVLLTTLWMPWINAYKVGKHIIL
ncbi:MAG: hypothetical protein Q8O31_01860 [Rhodocyclaceae bacterium]|nr:hypothetical protein [Rhodocyclaceae bacterium]